MDFTQRILTLSGEVNLGPPLQHINGTQGVELNSIAHGNYVLQTIECRDVYTQLLTIVR